MEDKIMLITGATSGIGKEAAKELAKQGHTIIVHGRNKGKTEAAVQELKEETGSDKIDLLLANLESFADIKRMADEFKEKYGHLDVLINNAGNQYGSTWEATAEGHEKTIMVNAFAPFLLTYLLLEPLSKSGEGRVITVSSASHDQGGAPFMDDIELKEHYSYGKVYGVSKLYDIWIMRHFVKYCEEIGIQGITFNCVHPGSARTNLGNTGNRPLPMKILFFLWRPMMTSVEKGAAPTIFAATSDEMKNKNDFYIGPKGFEKAAERYYTEANEKILWDYCMKIAEPYMNV
ncbi:SDR family NAD(P)-dependent oxidoreductase [Aminipila luticellarii]|uniref:SDR family NAD(P)-dependent oxidoreductase n=1 Tax=Aminipila luticellarii TaxID=2507160 RepID=A0A410PX79_9FIRM|nr:SDR family NAD(P)-dependent oxidoreductase [Aminipila luticellarii]QAT43562.1 SDR family NAD(P)-dependent oxidoreductase [Aminipila luticellarii]